VKILVLGSGGRENAIVRKISESKRLTKLYCAPGNPGIQPIAECVNININNNDEVIDFSKKNNIEMIVCGPEVPLVNGLADLAVQNKIKFFGPKKKGAMLEGSKFYAKSFMAKYKIPTADFEYFEDYKAAVDYINTYKNFPVVIKADGLAAGKGVKIPQSRDEALAVLKEFMIDRIHGDSSKSVVIEECMTGEEMSALFITDGNNFIDLIAAKDYKRAYDNNKGENTGGMGCYAPHTSVTDQLKSTIRTEIIDRVRDGFKREDIDFNGVLYVGLMLTESGPRVVEFNCRFGDPETQVILPLIDNDFIEILEKTADGKLDNYNIRWKKSFSACIVIASGGYPGDYTKGIPIEFKVPVERFLHAGTVINKDGVIVTNGGRVLNAVSLGNTKSEALHNAYELVKEVSFKGAFYRTDIGS